MVVTIESISLRTQLVNFILKHLAKYLIIILLSLFVVRLHAQNDTTAQKEEAASPLIKKPKHSPRKATLLSLALPGAGQVYNRKNWWWKVPIIYGVGGSLLYGGIFYQNGYNEYRDAYKERLATQTNNDPKFRRFQTPTLQVIRDSYRDARDQCYVWLIVVYTLQVLDATVEAHFFDFNIDENVSLNMQPTLLYSGNYYTSGMQLTLKF